MTVNYVSSNPVTSLVRGAKKEKKKTVSKHRQKKHVTPMLASM